MLETIAKSSGAQTYDEEIADALPTTKTSRLSALVHSAAYQSSIYFSIGTQPMALYGITALLKTVIASAKLDFNFFQCNNVH